MKKPALLIALACLSPLSQAMLPSKASLDKVMFKIAAKQWVTTDTALLTVNINATLNNADLVKARTDIMSNLTKIAPGEWQLTQFDRSQDSSGLEKLYVAAQARVPQASLTNIYQNAKTASRPGATYEINGVEFKPSLEETQQVKDQLREKLYQQISNELTRISKVYPSQHYSVHRIYFYEGEQAMPMVKAFQSREMNSMLSSAVATPAPAISVSNELILNAVVELANRDEELASASH